MSVKAVPIIIPASVEYVVANNLACLRFDYDLKQPQELPNAGELFTGLTPKQAADLIVFLQNYIGAETLNNTSQPAH